MHPRLDRGGAQAQDARDFPVREALNVPEKDDRSIVARELRQTPLDRCPHFAGHRRLEWLAGPIRDTLRVPALRLEQYFRTRASAHP
jgi:hypothetical protein